MSSAWFGLIGVVVGGLISTLWQWLAVVRQELSEAMVAARLVDEDLRGVDRQTGHEHLAGESRRAGQGARAKAMGRCRRCVPGPRGHVR
jgi:hypothetical protein